MIPTFDLKKLRLAMLGQQTKELRDPYRNVYTDFGVEYQEVVSKTIVEQILEDISNWKPFKYQVNFEDYKSLINIGGILGNAHNRWLKTLEARIDDAVGTSYEFQMERKSWLGTKSYKNLKTSSISPYVGKGSVSSLYIDREMPNLEENLWPVYELRAIPFYRVDKNTDRLIYDLILEFGPLLVNPNSQYEGPYEPSIAKNDIVFGWDICRAPAGALQISFSFDS